MSRFQGDLLLCTMWPIMNTLIEWNLIFWCKCNWINSLYAYLFIYLLLLLFFLFFLLLYSKKNRSQDYHIEAWTNCCCFAGNIFKCIFSWDQAALWMVFSVRLYVRPSVRPSVCPSVRLSVCHTFLTMFPSSYHHEIFRSYHIGPG